jgi:hypothetical protein
VKPGRILLFLALVAYVGSFFLTAAKDASAPQSAGFTGYWCALTTLTAPWGSDGLKEMRREPVEFFSILFSGWINPVFLITIFVWWRWPHRRLAWILGLILVIMLPSCWIVFMKAHLRPSVGYFVWTGAMVTALFSRVLSSDNKASSAKSSPTVSTKSPLSV